MRVVGKARLPVSLCVLLLLLLTSSGTADSSYNDTATAEQDDPPTLAESSWNSTKQNPLVMAITLKTADRLRLRSFKTEPVFEKGHLVGKWAGCGENAVQFSNCVVLASYDDRISMRYTYESQRSTEYFFAIPAVTALTRHSHPSIDAFDGDGESFVFTVFFNCVRKSFNSTEVFDLDVPILRNFNITTRFTKRCGFGPHPYVRLGITVGRGEEFLTNATGVIQVPPTSQTSNMFIRVVAPTQSILIGTPNVASSDKDIVTDIRGISTGTNILQGEDLNFWLVYDCVTNYKTHVSVTIPIPPWNDLTVHLEKSCGGHTPDMVDIGTGTGLSDIVDQGVVTGEYNVSSAVGYGNGVQNHVVGRQTKRIWLHIRNTHAEGLGPLHLGKLHVTMSNSETARVRLEDSGKSELGVLTEGRTRVVNVDFVCLQEGRVMVIFTLQLLQFRVLEFCVTKDCEQPRAMQVFGWENIWTVGGVEDVLFLVAAAILLACCIRNRGKPEILGRMIRGSGYERVSTG